MSGNTNNNGANAVPIEGGGDTTDNRFGLHATLTYEEVAQQGGPVDPLPETGIQPEIFRARRDVVVRVIPAVGSDVRREKIYLKRDSAGCRYVYRRLKEKKSHDRLQHGGSVFFALRMNRVEGEVDLYREPNEEDADDHLVAIKKQSLAKIRDALNRGHHENPFNAIKRMQTIGDDVHVLGCIEALKDDKHLYTIMKRCRGSILAISEDDETDISEGLPEGIVRERMMKVWKNLHYLQEHGIVHHDISPDNIMFLSGNLVLTDLAMSFQVAEGAYLRHLLLPQGRYGKPPYMSPEVFINMTPFDGFALDLWASGSVMYNLLTGQYLFVNPHPQDVLFRYFVMAKGLSNNPMNERTIEVMLGVFRNEDNIEDRQPLLSRSMWHIQLSATVKQLFENMFPINPSKRYSLSDCMESSWAQGEEHLWLNPANGIRQNQ